MFSAIQKAGVRRVISASLSLVLALSLLASALPQPALAAGTVNQTGCAKNHTVVAGDTVSAISVTYDISVPEIVAANSLKEPYSLFVGQVLCIPGTTTTTTETTTTGTTTTTSKSTGPEFTLEHTGALINVELSGYKIANYLVKVANGGTDRDWYKIGRFRVKGDKKAKSGSFDGVFKLPKQLLEDEIILVCVKNVLNDDTSCKQLITGFQGD